MQASKPDIRLPWQLVTSYSTLPGPILFPESFFCNSQVQTDRLCAHSDAEKAVACKQTEGDAVELITTTVLASSVSIHVIAADTDVVVMLMSQASESRTIYVRKTCILMFPDC